MGLGPGNRERASTASSDSRDTHKGNVQQLADQCSGSTSGHKHTRTASTAFRPGTLTLRTCYMYGHAWFRPPTCTFMGVIYDSDTITHRQHGQAQCSRYVDFFFLAQAFAGMHAKLDESLYDVYKTRKTRKPRARKIFSVLLAKVEMNGKF